mgnify:CR=1 FL=1
MGRAYFIKYVEESKTMSVSLASPDNWSEIAQEEAKKDPIAIVRYYDTN